MFFTLIIHTLSPSSETNCSSLSVKMPDAYRMPSQNENISLYRYTQDISIYSDTNIMLEGLIVTDQKGQKYRLVLIKNETAITTSNSTKNSESNTPPFGSWLKQERQRLKLTQKQLAQESGVLQPNIVAIEKGRRIPEPVTKNALISGLKKFSK